MIESDVTEVLHMKRARPVFAGIIAGVLWLIGFQILMLIGSPSASSFAAIAGVLPFLTLWITAALYSAYGATHAERWLYGMSISAGCVCAASVFFGLSGNIFLLVIGLLWGVFWLRRVQQLVI